MTEPLDDVWTTRDYPVLREAVRRIDLNEAAGIHELAAGAGLSLQEVGLAMRALRRTGYAELDMTAGGAVGIKTVSEKAYQATGRHPGSEDVVAQLVAALRHAADEVSDPEEKSKLRKLADGAGGVSRDVLTGALTAFITAAGRGALGM